VIKQGWVPPVSPYFLLQESLWPNEWMILVGCMFLNCTTRKQVVNVLPEFTKKWPTPQSLVLCDRNELVEVIRSLGFYHRRADNIIKMTAKYLTTSWKHVSELPGIGAYAARSWEIFCIGEIGDDAPKDHALKEYHDWLKGMQ